jgi:hypothetical protein
MNNGDSAMNLTPQDRIVRLLNDLAATNFQITPEQRIRALGLYMGLALEGPRAGRRPLANLIGPVLCRSAEEQVTFHRIFEYWFPPDAPAEPQPDEAEHPEEVLARAITEERRAATEEARRRLREAEQAVRNKRIREMLVFAGVMLLCAYGLRMVIDYYWLPSGYSDVGPPREQRAPAERPRASQPSQAQPKPSMPERPSPESRPARSGNALVRLWSSVDDTLGPAATLVLMIPLGLIAFVTASSRKLLAAYARQTQIVPKKDLRNLLSSGGDRLEAGSEFYRAVQSLRRRVEVSSSRVLDLDRTIDASILEAGAFTPVYASLRLSPEYVALVDRRSYGDHSAAHSLFLINALEQAGVNIVTYYFDRDPRRLTLGPCQRYLDLDDLGSLSRNRRLLIFSDGEGWLDPASGAPFDWTSAFRDWDLALLLTWKDPRDWYRSEWILETGVGLRVLPATEAGLMVAASLFEQQEAAGTSAATQLSCAFLPDRSRLYGFFATSGWRWLDDIVPPAEDIQALLFRLREGLSGLAFEWLSALAVYPALYWSLTLYLGCRLALAADRDSLQSALLEITRLPWLQHSRMPRWLREQLIKGMPPEQRDRVRQGLEELLLTVTSMDSKDVALEMGLNLDDGAGRTLRRMNRDDYRRDAILVDFMTRKQARTEDFPLRGKVLRALGLQAVDASIRELLARSDRELMRHAASDINEFRQKYPPRWIRTEMSAEDFAGFEVRDVVDWIDERTGDPAILPRKLRAFKPDPRYDTWVLIDDLSLSLWKRRRRLTWRFGLAGLIILSIALALYGAFWSQLRVGGVAIVASIIYLPGVLFWLLMVRPYSRLVRRFPTVFGSLFDRRLNSNSLTNRRESPSLDSK